MAGLEAGALSVTLLGLLFLLAVCAARSRRSGGQYPAFCTAILALLTIFVGVALVMALLRPGRL